MLGLSSNLAGKQRAHLNLAVDWTWPRRPLTANMTAKFSYTTLLDIRKKCLEVSLGRLSCSLPSSPWTESTDILFIVSKVAFGTLSTTVESTDLTGALLSKDAYQWRGTLS